MPPEPLSDEERIQLFVAPCGKLLTERAQVLATVFASVMAGGTGYSDDRLYLASKAVVEFLKTIDGQP